MGILRLRKESLNIAWSWGYLWFMCLNIVFSFWLLLRGVELGHGYFTSSRLETLNIGIIAFSILGIAIFFVTKKNKKPLFQFGFPLAVLIFGLLWSAVFYLLIDHYNNAVVTLTLMIMMLLPATIAFYISGSLLSLFCAPIVFSLLYSEITSSQKFNLMQMVGTAIILLVVVSARYILLEWYQRTQRSEYEKNVLIKKLTKLAHYDSLTGLFNKGSMSTYFEDNVRTLAAKQKNLFMIVLDIDFFKQYNDLYGHVAGDECLLKTSKCIENSLRRTNDAAFRFGGEEFVVITLCDDISQAIRIAERIQENIAQAKIDHKGSQVSPWLTASLGIAQWRVDMPLEALLEHADKELYKAKRGGRNRISFEIRNETLSEDKI